jgi:RNA polymerase sigma-70 factor (ECF subfamily)
MDIDLQGCIDGDKQAWDDFVARTAPLIVAAVRRTIRGGVPEVDDVVQDVYVRLIRDGCRALRSYSPTRSSMATWLTLVARSVAIDHLRRRGTPVVGLDGLSVEDRPGTPGPPEPSDQLDAGRLPMHVLTARQRLVLAMLFDRGLSVEEAAAALRVNEQTIRSTKHKALCRLRECVGGGGPRTESDLTGDEGRPSAVPQKRSTP